MASMPAPPFSMDSHQLRHPASTHTSSEEPDIFHDSIDQSFLSSYQSMKNSNSSSPSTMGASADYPSGTIGYDEHNNFPMLGDDFMDEALVSYHENFQVNNSVLPSVETPMDLPGGPSSQHNEGAPSPSQDTTQQQGGGQPNHFISSHVPSSHPSNSTMRPRTPQISVSTDTGDLQLAQDINNDSFAVGRKDSTPINATPSPSVVVGMWNSSTIQEIHSPMNALTYPHANGYFNPQQSTSTAVPTMHDEMTRGSSGGNWGDVGSGRRGMDPDRRQTLSQEEVPNFNDQKKIAEQEASLNAVVSWMTRGEESNAPVDEELPSIIEGRRSSNANNSPRSPCHASTASSARYPDTRLDDDCSIRSLSPEPIPRKNRIKEGQVYINRNANSVDTRDLELLQLGTGLSRLVNDAPVVLDIVDGEHDGKTSNAAMLAWQKATDNFSIISRRATWGTTRHSTETDIENITSGNLLKRLSIGKGVEKKPGFFNSVVKLARKNSAANKLKRNRSDAGISASSQPASEDRMCDSGSLAPPRTPSGNARRSRSPLMPRIETNVADLLMPSGHSYHGRRASTSNVSPTSSIGDFFGRHIRSRSRSKSELNAGNGLAEQWKGLGGPPIAIPSPCDDDKRDFTPRDGYSDAEGDDDDEEQFRQDANLAPDLGLEIKPTMDGFKRNILALNPHIKPYLVDRLAHQQMVRYKSLLQKRVNHEAALQSGSCPSARVCIRMGQASRPVEPKRKGRNSRLSQTVDDGSDSNPDNKIGPENFPPGIPMPPTDRFPAELECQSCFQVKTLQKPSDWTKHIQEDIAPFTCTWEGCKDAKSFKRKADYVRHENEKHRHIDCWNCIIDDCSHTCHRKDNFQAHLLREHRMQEPKAKTKAEIQKATGYDAEFWKIVDSCYRKSSAEPSHEPCKFCGKSFSTFKKLTGHEAKHMEQISLPIIALVESQNIDTNTIVSPVGPPPTSQQPQRPTETVSHASPYSQGHSSSHVSPGDSDFDLYPDASPTGVRGAPFNSNYSQSMFQISNQTTNYNMSRPMAAPQQGVHMSSGTAPIPIQHKYSSSSPAQQGHAYGEVSPLVNQLNNFAMSNQFQGYGQDTSRSLSRSYGSSMADASSPTSFSVTSAPFGGFIAAGTSMPMTTASYPTTYGMPTTAPQGQVGLTGNHLFSEIDPALASMGQTYGGISQLLNYGQYADDTAMHRSHSDSHMMSGMHQQYQQHQHQTPNLMQQQQHGENAGFVQQQQNLHPGPQLQGNRPRSTSGGNTRTRGGPSGLSQQYMRRI